MEHREIKTPEQIKELKLRSPGGYRNLREVVINELPEDELLRTPSVVDSTGGAISETQAKERGRMVKVADQVAELAFDNGLQVSESIAASLLPTPAVGHIRNHDEPIEDYLGRRQDFIDGKTKGMPGASLGVAVRMEMMPTPTTRDYKDGQAQHTRDGVVQTDTVARAVFNSGEVSATNWGKFTYAIERWEGITRPAPAPTKPDGKDGNHRLSAEFTEWMMGLPAGWVTADDLGLKRNDQLKACGNGVVPQQAELALRMLLQGLQIEFGGGKIAMLPTPTVSDTYTDNLKSSQQKEGSMHSVTLPQAIRQITKD
jgi:DNA (cytosine-5)-methyltransferase 1